MKYGSTVHAFSRRDFLKAAIAVGAAAGLATGLPAWGGADVMAQWGEDLVRGTANGQLFISADAGQTWQVLADFGPELKVRRIRTQRGQIHAQLEFRGRTFVLSSRDGRVWHTDEYRKPA